MRPALVHAAIFRMMDDLVSPRSSGVRNSLSRTEEGRAAVCATALVALEV